jgi:hypothetical protein
MEVPKTEIIRFLQQRGESDKAERASQQLPERLDLERDRPILERIGISPQDVLRGLSDT